MDLCLRGLSILLYLHSFHFIRGRYQVIFTLIVSIFFLHLWFQLVQPKSLFVQRISGKSSKGWCFGLEKYFHISQQLQWWFLYLNNLVIKCVYAQFCFFCSTPYLLKSVVVPNKQLLTHFSDEQPLSLTILAFPFPPAACNITNHLVTLCLDSIKFACRCNQENKQRIPVLCKKAGTGLRVGSN